MNWEQLRALFWLRWRLSRNQFARGKGLGAVLAVLALVLGLGVAVGGAGTGAVLGALVLAEVSPSVMMLVWDGLVFAFLFFWTLSILVEIQRSETIDLARLLHLPVALKQVFFLNYLASHFTFSIALVLPGMVGLAAGLVVGRGPVMILLFPLVVGFFFMVTAWTYCLRGWLAALMVNQRRRRAIVVGITLALMLLGQLPNLVNVFVKRHRPASRADGPTGVEPHRSARRTREEKERMLAVLTTAHWFVPPLWLPCGVRCLAAGTLWPALGGTVGAFLVGGLGLRRAYRSTLRFYQAEEKAKPIRGPGRTVQAAIRPEGKKHLFERQLPALPEEAGMLALATFRSMSRAPEVKMALAMNFVGVLLLAALFLTRGSISPGETAKPFVATGAVVLTFFGMLQLMLNQFGFDRDGFRVLVLLPAQRQHLLLGKNLSLLPWALGTVILFLAPLTVVARLPLLAVLAAGLQFLACFLMLCLAGNFVSIIAPYRIAPGSMKPTKMSGTTQLAVFVSHLLFPLAMGPLFLPPGLGVLFAHLGWLPAGPVNLALSLMLAAAAILAYWHGLNPLARLLQRREKDILQAVTQEVE